VLVGTDAAGCTHEVLNWIVAQRLSYSVGFTLPDNVAERLALIPDQLWTPGVRLGWEHPRRRVGR
jgi:hypothetical protein